MASTFWPLIAELAKFVGRVAEAECCCGSREELDPESHQTYCDYLKLWFPERWRDER